MTSIWDSIKNTVDSIGGAAKAPVGVVWDVASMPFDDKNDDFGSFIHAITSRGGDVLDPVFNPQTITGGAINKSLAAMNWAWQEGVSEPVATANMVNRHAFGAYGNFGAPGWLAATVTGNADLGALFSGQTWSDAYDRANQQPNALGAAFAYGALRPGSDPLTEDNPYEAVTKDHSRLAPALGWGGEFAGMIAGDPTAAALKGVGAVRSASQFAKLSQADKAALYSRITEGSQSGLLRPNLKTRTDKYLNWIDGTSNSLGRPLTGPEILHGSPELRKYAGKPHVIAGLLADANQITHPLERRDAQRRILAIAAGDVSQVDRLRTEVTEAGSIADQLTNMAKGGVLDLKALAQTPTLRTDPSFIQKLDSQLANLNSRGDVDRFLDDWNGRLKQMIGTSDTLPNLPGVHTAGKRAVLRQNETGKLRAVDNAAKKMDDWAAQRALKAQSASTVYQKGIYSLPVVAVKAAGLLASPYTKAPAAITDALRQTHFTGLANLHDWGAATTQLDSMMRLSRVTPGDRMKVLSEAFIAKTEPEKMRAIAKVEELSLTSLARHVAQKYGRPEVDSDYIKTLLLEHSTKRDSARAMLQGRAYAATKQSPDMLARAGSAGRAEDAARLEAGRTELGRNARLSAPETIGDWSTREVKPSLRVDQILDDGTPLSLPLLETQLSNTVPLMDMDIASALLRRDNGHLARLSRAWKQDQLELQRLSNLKGKGALGLDRAIEAKAASIDYLVSAGQTFMRAWKMGVLFRLGYPVRVLMDDHFRIWSQMNAMSFYGGNASELFSNLKFNQLDRRIVGQRELHNLKVRRQEILDELEGGEMVTHLDRQNDLRSIEASLKTHQRNIAKLRKQVEDAETKQSLGLDPGLDLKALRTKLAEREKDVAEKEAAQAYYLEQLGDYGPDDLKRELETIEEQIRGGWRGQADDKRKLGTADVAMPDGTKLPGAFADNGIMRVAASSNDSFDNQLRGVEDRMYRSMAGGAHRTIAPTERGHLHAWADVLNNQIRNSPVAMHFLNGGDVPSFVRWIRQPEQAELRRRVAHFAHDPEDWGGRVQSLIWDYVPSDDLRQALLSGRVTAQRLGKMFSDPTMRPAVHGRALADNIGSSHAVQTMGRLTNRIYKVLGEMPTDRLSRHPFFNSLYQSHAKEIYGTRRAGYGASYKFSQDDLNEIATQARKMALHDLRQTLFDVSAHSHAAHMLRFISPFFAAHQEAVGRWWRIFADNPVVLRRYLQAFDVPRYLGVEVDENGELVKPGSPISRQHRILLQLPKAFGGPDVSKFQSKWTISESAFNIVLQGGLTNPGVGPVVSIPMEWAVEKYAQEAGLARIARVFNPFPPNSPMEGAIPAWYKRFSAGVYGETGIDPSLIGVGKREYTAAWGQYVQDMTVDFQRKNGREPNANESAKILEEAGSHATSQMFHRLLWNMGSPAPATPQSKYAAVQQGWYKISEQARAEGKDFDWAYAQFKDKYGEAYLPLIYSTSNNPAWVDSTPATVGALKHYKRILNKVDPALTRVIVGAYANDLIANDATLGEYSPDARNWLRDTPMRPGSKQAYYSYDDPATAMEEQMARRGWAKYGELTAALTAQAKIMGLESYEDDDQLVAMKRLGVAAIKEGNYAFAKDYDTVDSGQYDRYLADMRDIASAPQLINDPERTDIQALQQYLAVRDYFTQILDERKAAGLGGPDAEANAGIRSLFTTFVNNLVESNLDFEEFIFNGLVERDPLLVRSQVVTQ